MKPLVVLLIVSGIALFTIKLFLGEYDLALAARIAMSAMLVFTAIGHFAFPNGMAMMLPAAIPFKKEVVFATGIMELAAAAGLLVPSTKLVTARLLILFFIVVLPANINAAIKHIDYQKGTAAGNGPAYLWFRIPLQLLFIAWTYSSCIRF